MKKIIVLSAALLMLNGMSVQASLPSSLMVQQRGHITRVESTVEGKQIFELVNKYSKKYRVDKRLVHAIIMVESNYRTNIPHKKGACLGLMQINPYYAGKKGFHNLLDPEENISYGTKHIAGLLARYRGNEELALAAYNCGGNYVDKFGGEVPPVAKGYVNKVITFKELID